MTEAEWLRAKDPEEVLGFLCERGSGKKLRLFAVACCSRISTRITDLRGQRAVEVAEQFADGMVDQQCLLGAFEAARGAWSDRDADDRALEAAFSAAAPHPSGAATWAASMAAEAVGEITDPDTAERLAQVCLLREIFGNPFRPVSFSSEWLTSTAVAIARQMYELRDFSAMPVLADALQDAGCNDADVLAHCREPCRHVRGCWVVDLVLNRE